MPWSHASASGGVGLGGGRCHLRVVRVILVSYTGHRARFASRTYFSDILVSVCIYTRMHTCVSMYTQPSCSIRVLYSVQMRHSLNPRVIPRCRVISLLLRSLTIIIINIIIIITIVIIIFVAYLHICKVVLCQFCIAHDSQHRQHNFGLS